MSIRTRRACDRCGTLISVFDLYEVRVELRNVRSRNHGKGQTLGQVCVGCGATVLAEVKGRGVSETAQLPGMVG